MKTVQKLWLSTGVLLLVLLCFHLGLRASDVDDEALGDADAAAATRQLVVFGCSPPQDSDANDYDCVFNLPLTALVWRRLGFESVVQLVGSPGEWLATPALRLVVQRLQQLNVTVLYMETSTSSCRSLVRIARLFAINNDDFPGDDGDYLVSSETGAWPPWWRWKAAVDDELLTVDETSEGHFEWNGTRYAMRTGKRLGARVATWRRILNRGAVVNSSESLLDHLVDVFGEPARRSTGFGAQHWPYDQALVSIRIHQWFDGHNSTQPALPSNETSSCTADREASRDDLFRTQCDLHPPSRLFEPQQWDGYRQFFHQFYVGTAADLVGTDDYVTQFGRLVLSKKSES